MRTPQGNSLGNRSIFTSFGERLALYRLLHLNFLLDWQTLQDWNGGISSTHLCYTIRDFLTIKSILFCSEERVRKNMSEIKIRPGRFDMCMR
jgi:hypothetical protein